jgi:trans-2,3-dihydro-3-hydroxyanthranilate isomerase
MPATPRSFDFVQIDVFTSKPLQGNQLAVFLDGHGLTDLEMQRIARETNLSETTFILPRDASTEGREGHRVRIFTAVEELPFAGHPTLGTATVIRGESSAKTVDLHLNVGKIPVTYSRGKGGLDFGEMRQNDPEFGEIHSLTEIAAVGGLSPADIRSEVPVQTVSTGNAFIIVPVRSLAAIQRMEYKPAIAKKYLESHSGKFFYWICLETSSPETQIHARMMFYNGEDPATGSAAGPAIAWLVQHGLVASEKQVVIEQGIEIGRLSRLYVRAKKDHARITDVRVGGYAVEVARGTYKLP